MFAACASEPQTMTTTTTLPAPGAMPTTTQGMAEEHGPREPGR